MEDVNRIKLVLVEKKRTSKWLAEQLGVNPSTVSKWCTVLTPRLLASGVRTLPNQTLRVY